MMSICKINYCANFKVKFLILMHNLQSDELSNYYFVNFPQVFQEIVTIKWKQIVTQKTVIVHQQCIKNSHKNKK